MTDNQNNPDISVIVTVVDGGDTLVRCLDALLAQEEGPRLEVIIPFDSSIAEVGALASQYPNFDFLDLGDLADRPPANEFEQHELYDRRRTAGLRAARTDLLAMIEDRGWPRPDWAKEMVKAHRTHDDAVIGGGIDNAERGLVRWAIFFLDFGRYQAPFETDDPEYVSDTNICYKRAAIEEVEHLWRFKYQESVVNWALRDKKAGLRLEAGPMTMQQRSAPGLVEMTMERVHWARTFGQVRARGASLPARLKWMAITPLLPIVLYVRHLRRQLRIGRHVPAFLMATPVTLYLLTFWSIGEFIGYLEAKGAEAGELQGEPSSS